LNEGLQPKVALTRGKEVSREGNLSDLDPWIEERSPETALKGVTHDAPTPLRREAYREKGGQNKPRPTDPQDGTGQI